jgi:uncharacterized membrane protein (UPF0127 family)
MSLRRDLAVGGAVLAVGLVAVALALPIPLGDPGPYERATVTIADANGTELATVGVRMADTPEQRYVGLSRTESLPAGEGMLFVHDSEATQSYVMRGMSFPLDIVFVGADGRITRIVHAPADRSGAPYRASARYVLEVPRGWANTTGVEPGDRVTIPER